MSVPFRFDLKICGFFIYLIEHTFDLYRIEIFKNIVLLF